MSRTPLIEQLAAELIGPPTGDPLRDALRETALLGVARIAEMNDTGFDTTTPFDHNTLAPYVGTTQGIFTVVSLGKTGTTYLVVLSKRVGDAYQAAVQVYHSDKIGDKFYKMTLVCAPNGTIRMNAGW